VELVYRGEVFYGEVVRVFPGGAQCGEDLLDEIAMAVVLAYQPVIAVVALAFSLSSAHGVYSPIF
jgi:hypothetical protein